MTLEEYRAHILAQKKAYEASMPREQVRRTKDLFSPAALAPARPKQATVPTPLVNKGWVKGKRLKEPRVRAKHRWNKAPTSAGKGFLKVGEIPSVPSPKVKRGFSRVEFAGGALIVGKKPRETKVGIMQSVMGPEGFRGGIAKRVEVPRSQVASDVRLIRRMAARAPRVRDIPSGPRKTPLRRVRPGEIAAGGISHSVMQSFAGSQARVRDLRARAEGLRKAWATRRRKYGKSGIGKKGGKRKAPRRT